MLTYNDIKFFFEKLKYGDANNYSYRVILMDVLVERIYLYEGDDPRLEIYCRASDQKITYPINEPRGSFMGQLARPMRFERTTYRVGVCHSIQLSYGRMYGVLGGLLSSRCYGLCVVRAGYLVFHSANTFTNLAASISA